MEEPQISYEILQKNILLPKCASCHKGPSSSEAKIMKWIEPGNPEESTLYQEVSSGNMPYGPKDENDNYTDGENLSEKEVKMIYDYIKNFKPAAI